ncbi:hypothetical protein [Methanobrevibacter sp.]
MSTKTNFSTTDTKFCMMIRRLNLTKDAIKNYNTVFKEIYELFNVINDIVKIGKRY